MQIPVSSLFTLIDEQMRSPESIPVKCYELVSKENEEQQEKLLKLLEDVIEYKR